MKMNRKILIILLAIITGFILAHFTYQPIEIEMVLDIENDLPQTREELLMDSVVKEMLFTSYWPNEPGHNSKTHAGIDIDKFRVNAEGWYTYGTYVVLAGATNECLQTNVGACKVYSDLPKGFISFEFYDLVDFKLDDKEYKGIILDSCGKCMVEVPGEDQQRIDIYVSEAKYSVGKEKGEIEFVSYD